MSTQWLVTLLIVSHGISMPPAGTDKHVWWLGSWDSLARVCVACMLVPLCACRCVSVHVHVSAYACVVYMVASVSLMVFLIFAGYKVLRKFLHFVWWLPCLPYVWQIQATP